MAGIARNVFVVVILVGAFAWSFSTIEPMPGGKCHPNCAYHSPDMLYGPGRGPGPLSAGTEFGPELIVNYLPATM